MLEVSIKKKYRGFQLNIEFSQKGKKLGILGASGCGKTMTLKCIAGIITPDEGRIVLDGRVLFDSEKKINLPPQQRNVGYLFQNYALFPNMTVEENIGITIPDKKQRSQQVASLMRQYQLEGLEKNYPHELSGGQQQRVALVRMLASNPQVILLDEPFSALDSFLKDAMQRQLFDALKDFQGAVVMVSHNRDEIYRFCEHMMVMDKGSAVSFGDTQKIFANPGNTVTARLTGCKNIASAKKVDEHTVFIPRWNTKLHIKQPVKDGLTAIGVRAHDFEPVWNRSEPSINCIVIQLVEEAALPFERQYYVKTADSPLISWFVQREKVQKIEQEGMPSSLFIPEEKVLFLFDEQ